MRFCRLILIATAIWLGFWSDVLADAEPGSAESAQGSFVRALAQQGLFHVAALEFAELRQKGFDAPALHRAEGNSWLLAKDIPQAILAYRRWQRIAPDDPLMVESLEYARAQVAFASSADRAVLTPRSESWPAFKHHVRQWRLVAIAIAVVLGWFALARWCILRAGGWLAFAILAFAGGALLTGSWLIDRVQRRAENSRAVVVVIRPELLRSGDGSSYLPRRESASPAGVEAVVRHHRGAWLQVELADGSIGWLPESSVRHLE
jgi:hypothetical protein